MVTPRVIWFTGLSGAGKTTIASALTQALAQHGLPACLLDGDQLRRGLNHDLGFSRADRAEQIRRTGELCKILHASQINAIAALISPLRLDRENIRASFPFGTFIEIYLACPLAVCEARDVKGLYAQARAGKVPEFTGISSPYEPPDCPEILLRTDLVSPTQALRDLLDILNPFQSTP